MQQNLRISLFLMRITVFAVFAMWTLAKFSAPDRIAGVFGKFYFLPGMEAAVIYGFGAAQAIIIICFVLGLFKRISYGLVLVMHAISTFSSYMMYFNPEGMLFWAAWPMLAACVALYLLRDEDTFLSLGK